MSLDPMNSPKQDEIDFSNLSRGIGNSMSGVGGFVFKSIQFIIRNIILVAVLLIVGFALGLYLDSSSQKYDHKVTVTPNFESVDYLYSKIEVLESKIRANDTVFLKSAGFSNPKAIRKIKIEPIVDIYKFAKQEDIYFKTLALLSEGASMQQVMEDKVTARNYKYHQILFSTKNPVTEAGVVAELLEFLNDSEFFAKMQKEYRKSLELKIAANDVTLADIDNILNTSVQNSAKGIPASGTVVFTEKTQLNDMIYTKNNIIERQESNRVNLLMYDKIIKESIIISNMKDKSAAGGIMKVVLPLLLIMIFAVIAGFKKFYYRQKIKYATTTV